MASLLVSSSIHAAVPHHSSAQACARTVSTTFISSPRLFNSRHRTPLVAPPAAIGSDAVYSWLDLAGFVAPSNTGRGPFDDLADKIGRDCYIDVQGWHLYLKDVKVPNSKLTLAQALAHGLGAQIQGQGFSKTAVDDLIAKVPVKLGGGKSTLSLAEVMPARAVADLIDICEQYARNM